MPSFRSVQSWRLAVRGVLLLCCADCTNSAATLQSEGLEPIQETESSAAADVEGLAPADALVALATDEGFHVQEGRNEPFFFPEDCEDLPSCYSGNATSPYAFFSVPPSPGAAPLPTTHLGAPSEDGVSRVFNLRQDEAVVYLGRTPPRAAYFSYTPYLFSRADADGEHVDLFASLTDSFNQINLALGDVDSPFDAPLAMIVTAHRGIAERVQSWLRTAGIPVAQQNLMVIPSDIARLGATSGADRLMVLQRFALFEDPAQGEAYLRELPARVFRLSPADERPADPLPTPPRQPRGSGTDEQHLLPALDALEAAIRQAHSGSASPLAMLSPSVVSQAIHPELCIDQLRPCQGEVSDTVYSAGPRSHILTGEPNRLSESAGDYFVAFGVNHEASGKALYSNFVVQNAARQAGIAAFTSREMVGSAQVYLPDHPDAGQLFAVKVARDCEGQSYCLEIATGFPGVALDEDIMFLGRSYIQPGTSVSPGTDEVLTERVLRFGSTGESGDR